MPLLDVRTVFLLCVSFIFFYGIGMVVFARKMPAFNGLYLFAAANFFIAIGITLSFFRDHIDVFWSIIVSNSLTLVGANLVYQGHLRFMNVGHKQPLFPIILLISTITLLFIFTYSYPNTNIRVLLQCVFYCVQFALIAKTAWRFQQQNLYSPLAIIAACFSLFFISRLIVILLDERSITYGLSGNFMRSLQVVFLMLYIALLDFFVVLIATEQLVQKIADLAYKDPLTALYNRRGLDYTLVNNSVFEQALTVIICDIDHFKAVNDQYGHNIGDLVIQKLANLIRELTRKTDICTRWGGEEFLIILPLLTVQQALIVAEKIRAACEQYSFPEQQDLLFTCSFGICSKKDTHSLDELIGAADKALYQAKMEGRNRVCIFNDDNQ